MFGQFRLRVPVFLVLLVIGQSYCYAQSELAAKVGEVIAVERGGQVEIQVPMEGRVVRPRTSRLNDPERAVFDFSGTVPKVTFSRVKVNRGAVIAVRTAAFEADRQGKPVTRVVVDLTQPVKYQTRVEAGKFIISFNSSPDAETPAITAKNSTLTQPRPAPSPVAKPAPVLDRPKLEAKAATVNRRSTEFPVATVPSSQTPSVPSFQLQDLSIQQASDRTSITLRFNQEPTPHVSTLTDPKRLVIDFPGAVFAAGWNKPAVIRLQSGSVLSVRSAIFKQGPHPPVLRVVFDEIENVVKPKTLIDGNTVTLEFSDGISASPAVAVRRPVPSELPSRVQTKQITPAPLREPTHAEPPLVTSATQGIQPHPPVVTYNGGLLYVDAENCNLTDVLFAISEKTGAGIELPMSEGMLDRVVIRIGPGRPREVLARLLEGSPYNYLIMENAEGALDKVVLQPKDFAPPPPPTSGN